MSNQDAGAEVKRKRESSRDRIVDAAYQILAEKGYNATTFKEIARSAQAAQGLIHYYFGSKDQLLLEVLKEASERTRQEMQRFVAALPEERPRRGKSVLAQQKHRVTRQPEWYRLRYELFALGMRKPELLPSVGELLAKGRRGVGQVLGRLAGKEIADREALSAVMLACFDGLALQKLADPDFDLDGAYRVLDRMIGSVVEER
ncbi:MAG: TetR/AcrR family transcriptional regulator [Actinomycetota bacterium]|nr:TetR/AcrR family transcriptional regulator [Actinomycetota bacterium]